MDNEGGRGYGLVDSLHITRKRRKGYEKEN